MQGEILQQYSCINLQRSNGSIREDRSKLMSVSVQAEERGSHMLSSNTAVAVNVHGVDIAIWSGAQHCTAYWIMACETGHITSVWASCCCCWRSLYSVSQSITISTLTHRHTQTHTLITLTVILLCKCTKQQTHTSLNNKTRTLPPAMETKPSPSVLFNMHSVNRPHDELQHISAPLVTYSQGLFISADAAV